MNFEANVALSNHDMTVFDKRVYYEQSPANPGQVSKGFGRGLLYPFAQETTVSGAVVFAHANSVATTLSFAKG